MDFYLIRFNMLGVDEIALAVDNKTASKAIGYEPGEEGDYCLERNKDLNIIIKSDIITREDILKLKVPKYINFVMKKEYIKSAIKIDKSEYPEIFV